jgi:hypothetical protein
LQLLKWRTLREKFSDAAGKAQGKMEVNTKILGLGPIFNLQIEIENLSEEVIFGVGLMLNYDREKLRVLRSENRISMIAPFTPSISEVQIESLSLKNENLVV